MSKKKIISKVKFRLLEKYTVKNLLPSEEIINDCIDETLAAINYTRCCETLNDKEVISFDLCCDIKNIHHSFDEYYLWDTTLIEYEIVLKMYESFVQNL